MAKTKTAHIKQPKMTGYGMGSPWDFDPANTETRGMSSAGAGDYYGSGIRNPIGKSREISMDGPVSKKGLQTPPKKLA